MNASRFPFWGDFKTCMWMLYITTSYFAKHTFFFFCSFSFPGGKQNQANDPSMVGRVVLQPESAQTMKSSCCQSWGKIMLSKSASIQAYIHSCLCPLPLRVQAQWTVIVECVGKFEDFCPKLISDVACTQQPIVKIKSSLLRKAHGFITESLALVLGSALLGWRDGSGV